MARSIEVAEPALYKYSKAVFSHIPKKPGESALLVSDPWAYLHAHIEKQIKTTRQEKRANAQLARHFAQLAEDFYSASEQTELPSKGTIIYYGMLNLVKCLLSFQGLKLGEEFEQHGLSLPLGDELKVEVKGRTTNSINIFAEFASLLGTPVSSKITIPVGDIFREIPEIHEVCANLGHFKKRKFLPVRVEILTNQEHSHLFTELIYEKRHENVFPVEKLRRGRTEKYFREPYQRDDVLVLRSFKRKRLGNWDTIYQNILKEYEKFRMASLLTRQGYRYYWDLEPAAFHHLCFSLMLMFLIGTAARYRPVMLDQALSGDTRPPITEACRLVPNQFLFHLVSRIIGRPCIIPYSDL